MKKSLLLSLVLLSWILLTACGNKSDDEKAGDIDKNVQSENLVDNQESEKIAVNDCEKAIQKYLDGADKEWKGEWVKQWDNITVDYIWRLDDGTIFDTSIQSIAEACWKYVTWADYTKWLSFEVWTPWLIEWFNEWVDWMKLWQTKTVKFWPEKWYWDYMEDYVITYKSDEIWDLSLYEVWDYFQPNEYVVGKIINITDKEMVVDFNSELAW
jgi:FKBP-type peptidyl-prolyl cis-trans isomerase 2